MGEGILVAKCPDLSKPGVVIVTTGIQNVFGNCVQDVPRKTTYLAKDGELLHVKDGFPRHGARYKEDTEQSRINCTKLSVVSISSNITEHVEDCWRILLAYSRRRILRSIRRGHLGSRIWERSSSSDPHSSHMPVCPDLKCFRRAPTL